MIHLTRRYRFSASHRLHNEALSAEENRRLYGKCDNLFGHGHNYVLDVTMAGPVEPETGMVFDLVELGPHPFRDGLALQPETAGLGRPAVVREAKEVERLGLVDATGFAVSGLARQSAT